MTQFESRQRSRASNPAQQRAHSASVSRTLTRKYMKPFLMA